MPNLPNSVLRIVRRCYRDAVRAEVVEAFHRTGGWKPAKASLEWLAAKGHEQVNLKVVQVTDPSHPEIESTCRPDYRIAELLPRPKLPENMRLAYPSFGALQAAVELNYAEAASIARSYDFKFTRSRGRHLLAINDAGRVSPEEVPWNGTLKEIVDLAREYAPDGATEIIVSGGFDGSDYFDFDPYDVLDGSFWDVTALVIARESSPKAR